MTPRGTKYWSSGAIPLIAPELLGDIIATASDIALVVSAEGRVLSVLVNQATRSFGRIEAWEGHDLRDFLTPESVGKLDAQLAAVAAARATGNGGAAPPPAAELNHSDGTRWEFPIRYTFHPIGPDGAVLMLGRDLRPIAEMQQQLVRAQLALEQDYEAQREYDTRYRVLMETIHDAMAFVALSTGRISDVNAAAAQLLGATREELLGAPFAQEFEGRRRGEFMESLTGASYGGSGVPVEAVARRSRRRVRVTPTLFRAAGERILLCRIEPAEAVSPIGDELTQQLAGLFHAGVDAIVFTDAEGIIRAANESFLGLADLAHPSMAKGRSLADFLGRGSIDLKVLLENAVRAGQMRMYATRIVSEFGGQVAVEMSATYLADRQHPAVVFVIRDASRLEAARRPGTPVSDEAIKSVMDLVGSATLKDIVAETTDVVEKLCIETAIELTRNNRVAAAEMLGLSRQSLYVKLRKYGMLGRGEDG